MMSIVHDKEKRVELSKPSVKNLLEEYRKNGMIEVEEMNEDLRSNLNW